MTAWVYEALLEELRVANAMMDDGEGMTTKADAIETAMDVLADAGLLVGVDITPPGIEIEEDDRFADDPDAFNFDIFDDENEDSTPVSIRCRCWRVPKSAIPTAPIASTSMQPTVTWPLVVPPEWTATIPLP